MLEIIQLQQSAEIAVVAYCVCCELIRQGRLLERYLNFLFWVESIDAWVAKPLGMCEVCFAGQVALWWFLCDNYGEYWYYFNWTLVIKHIIFICLTITLTVFIKKVITKK